jgi:hypothetical protein
MNGVDILIDKVLAESRLTCAKNRREVAAELRCHLEDSMNEVRKAGYADEEAERQAVTHFGSTELVSRDFAKIYRFERVRFYVVAFGLLLFASIVAAAGFIYLVQRILVIEFGLQQTPVLSARHLALELLLVVSTIIGYFGLFFTRRLFSRGHTLKALVVVGIMFLLAAGMLRFWIHGSAPILAAAYISAVFVAVAELRFGHWIAKFMLVAAAFAAFGTVLGAQAHSTSTCEIMVTALIWTTIAVSCCAVALFTSLFDRRVLSGRFAGSSVAT